MTARVGGGGDGAGCRQLARRSIKRRCTGSRVGRWISRGLRPPALKLVYKRCVGPDFRLSL